MEQHERADRDWDHLESEEAYLPGNDSPDREELPPSLDYTPTLPKRVEEHEPLIREPRERLSRIFADEAHDVEGPTYGRDEPGLRDHHDKAVAQKGAPTVNSICPLDSPR